MKTLILMLCACALSAVAETGAAVNAKPIKMDSLMGYTLGKKYSFEGFHFEDPLIGHAFTHNKKLSPCEILSIDEVGDGTICEIQHQQILSDIEKTSEKLALAQEIITNLETACCLELKFETLKYAGDPLLYWVCEDADTKLTVSYVYNASSGNPAIRDGILQVNLLSKKIQRRKQEKVSQ